MKILFISNVYPNPIETGKGTFNQAMISALGQRHDVQVVCPIAWTTELMHGIRTKKILRKSERFQNGEIKTTYPGYYFTPKFGAHHYGGMMWYSLRKTLLMKAESFRPDVILSYWTHPDGEVAVRLGEMISCPVAVMTGGSDVLILTQRSKRKLAIQNVLNQADAIITVSKDIRNHVEQLTENPEKIHVVYRGVDQKLFSPSCENSPRKQLGLDENKKHFLFVGRLVSVKGLENLIETCRRVADQRLDFCCQLVGSGPLENKLKQKIQELGLEGKVILEGSKEKNELALWYQACDAVVLPSLSEGVPNVLLETISCGKSFIASRVGGIPEIADEQQDILVPPGDSEKLAEAMIIKMETHQKNSQRSFVPSSWEESSLKLESVLEALVNQERVKVTGELSKNIKAVVQS